MRFDSTAIEHLAADVYPLRLVIGVSRATLQLVKGNKMISRTQDSAFVDSETTTVLLTAVNCTSSVKTNL